MVHVNLDLAFSEESVATDRACRPLVTTMSKRDVIPQPSPLPGHPAGSARDTVLQRDPDPAMATAVAPTALSASCSAEAVRPAALRLMQCTRAGAIRASSTPPGRGSPSWPASTAR